MYTSIRGRISRNPVGLGEGSVPDPSDRFSEFEGDDPVRASVRMTVHEYGGVPTPMAVGLSVRLFGRLGQPLDQGRMRIDDQGVGDAVEYVAILCVDRISQYDDDHFCTVFFAEFPDLTVDVVNNPLAVGDRPRCDSCHQLDLVD